MNFRGKACAVSVQDIYYINLINHIIHFFPTIASNSVHFSVWRLSCRLDSFTLIAFLSNLKIFLLVLVSYKNFSALFLSSSKFTVVISLLRLYRYPIYKTILVPFTAFAFGYRSRPLPHSFPGSSVRVPLPFVSRICVDFVLGPDMFPWGHLVAQETL